MKKINKKNLIVISSIILLLVLMLIIAVVLLNKDEKQTVNLNNETPGVEKTKEISVVDINSKSRPYAVMINNISVARQVQSGLNDAYMVYEIIVEGGITRFLALYKDAETAKIGSVRSARHYYLDYVLENDAIFVHWGQSGQAKSDIQSLGINNINGLTYEGTYFYRDNPLGISSEHTGFTKMEHLNKAVDKLKYRKETDKGLLLNYSAESVELKDSKDAKVVTIDYSRQTQNKYVYDEDNKVYNRFVNEKEHKDYVTGNQIAVKNIIVYAVENYTIAGDKKGRQFLDNIGSGDGYFITEGKALKIKWSKKNRESKTEYTLEDGSKLIVNDGNTFIQIMPLDGNLVIE